jgi:hypothetical protein
MRFRVRFENMRAPQRVLFLVGLILMVISFFFPSDSPLHAGGGASLGLLMLILAAWGACTWLLASLSLAAGMACVSGGFWHKYDRDIGFVLSMLGVALVALVLVGYVYGQYRASRQS